MDGLFDFGSCAEAFKIEVVFLVGDARHFEIVFFKNVNGRLKELQIIARASLCAHRVARLPLAIDVDIFVDVEMDDVGV